MRSYNSENTRNQQSSGYKSFHDRAGICIQRLEIENFGRAIFGAGEVFGSPLGFDDYWNELGKATVVDVGGGIGIDLSYITTRR